MPRIVVLGAAGFVGRALVRRLARDGHAVTAVTRGPAALGDGIAVVPAGTLGPQSGWSRTLDGAAAVIHLASAPTARGAGPDAQAWIAAEAATARHVAEEIAQARVPQVILLSSILAHGEHTIDTPFRADQPLAPATPYGRAKAQIEREMSMGLAATETALAILRPPLLYGPEVGYRFRMLMGLVRRAPVLPFASIRNRRGLLFRENLVDLVSHILRCPEPVAGVYLARDEEELSTPELVRRLGAALGHAPLLLPCPPALLRAAGRMIGRGDIIDRLTQSLQLDDSAARRALGWMPPHSVEAGFGATCRWYLDQQQRRP